MGDQNIKEAVVEAPEEDQPTDVGLVYELIRQLKSKPVGKQFKLAQQQCWKRDDKGTVYMLMMDDPDNRVDEDAEKVAVESYYTEGRCGHIVEEERMKVTHRIYIQESIGRGGYGIVYKAEIVGPRFQDPSLCLKMALHRRQYKNKTERAEGQKKINRSIFKEAEIFAKLSKDTHKNIIGFKFHCTTQKENEMLIGLDYFEGVNLHKTLEMFKKRGDKRLPSKTLHKIMVDTTSAVEHLFNLDIVHCDIKPQNILYNCCEPETVKLIDFGCAVQLDITPVEAEATAGTPEYMAPEALLHGRPEIDKESDISGLGSLFYLLVTFEIPWHHCKEVKNARRERNRSEVWRLIKSKYQTYDDQRLPDDELSTGAIDELTELQTLITKKTEPYYISQSLECELIKDMLSFDMDKRPSCGKILKYIDRTCKDIILRQDSKLSLSSCDSENTGTPSSDGLPVFIGLQNSSHSNPSTVPSDVKKMHKQYRSPPKPLVQPESESADSFAPPLPPRSRRRERRGPTLSMDATSGRNPAEPPQDRSRVVTQGFLGRKAQLPNEDLPALSVQFSSELGSVAAYRPTGSLPVARGRPRHHDSPDEGMDVDAPLGAATQPDEAPLAESPPSPHVGAAPEEHGDIYVDVGGAAVQDPGQDEAKHYSGHIGDGMDYLDGFVGKSDVANAGNWHNFVRESFPMHQVKDAVQATDSIDERVSYMDLGTNSDAYEDVYASQQS